MGYNTYSANNTYTGEVIDNRSISIANPFENYAVYQRNLLNEYTAAFDVTFVGSPANLSYRLLNAGDNSEITPWAVFDAAPSGGTSLLEITRSSSNFEYLVEVRQDESTTVTSRQSLRWSVGVIVPINGQSLAEGMDSRYPTSLTSNVYRYDVGSGFNRSTTGEGMRELGRVLNIELGCIVALINTAVRGTCLTGQCSINKGDDRYWSDYSGSMYQDAITAIQEATDGQMAVEFMLWMQGGTDASQGISKAEYKTEFESFISRLRSDVLSKESGNALPIVTGTLGGSGSVPDDDRQAIREAILEVIEADSLMLPLPIYPYSTYDGTHPDEAGNTGLGRSAALIYSGNSAPYITSAAMEDTEITLTFNEDLEPNNAYDTTGLRVNSGGTIQNVSSFTRTANRTAVIELSQAPSDYSDIDILFSWGSKGSESQLSYPADTSGIYAIPYFSYDNDFSIPVVTGPTVETEIVGDGTVDAGAVGSLISSVIVGDAPISTYLWEQIEGPECVIATPSNQNSDVTFTLVNDQQVGFRITVTDENGLSDTANAYYTIFDRTAPTVELIGLDTVSLKPGEIWQDPGAIISDNIDADRIVGSGDVSYPSNGDYIKTYGAGETDAAGNEVLSTVTRNFEVTDKVNYPFFVRKATNVTQSAIDSRWPEPLRREATDSYTLTIAKDWRSVESIESYSVETYGNSVEIVHHQRQGDVIQVYLRGLVSGKSGVTFRFATETRNDRMNVEVLVTSREE